MTMPNATPLPQGFDELITAVVNAAYDCGDFRGEGADYQEEYQPLIDKSRAAKDALRAAIAALAEDAARLDWLEANANDPLEIDAYVGLDDPSKDRVFLTGTLAGRLSAAATLRAAIDTARKEAT